MRDVEYYYDQWSNCSTNELELAHAIKRKRAMVRIQQSLIAAQELGDEKLQIVNQMQELIDHKTRQLDHDFKNLDYGNKDDQMLDLPHSQILSIASTSGASVASPVNTNSVASVLNSSNAAATIVSGSGSASGTPTADRFSASTNSATPNNERSSKRARRARADNGGNSGAITAAVSSTTASGNVGSGTVAITEATSSDTNPSNDLAQKQSNLSSGSQSSAAAQKKATAASGGKKKKRKSGRGQANTNAQAAAAAAARDNRDETPPPEEAIDPDEPTYCLCDQISFGEMILCDNDLCPIEWFHFSCVSLMSKPKGKWYCPNCRGDRPNMMKPKAQFLKELERYNKEKEEKT